MFIATGFFSCAAFVITYLSPCISCVVFSPSPDAERTQTTISSDSYATPVLFPATMPATAVPCPEISVFAMTENGSAENNAVLILSRLYSAPS